VAVALGPMARAQDPAGAAGGWPDQAPVARG
jgi:hypothetical protein